LKKSLLKDSLFGEAYALASKVSIEKGSILEAIHFKNKMISVSPVIPLIEYFFLSGMQMSIGDYKNCLINANKYKSSPMADERFIPNIGRMINNCVFALNAIKDSVNFKPFNLGPGINTAMPEYFPSVTADDSTLLFTRRINDRRAVFGGKQEDIFVTKKSNNIWGESNLISRNINTEFNEGAPTFSTDGQYIIFVGCETGSKGDYEYGDDRKGYGSCDLFYSQNIGNQWSKPRNLGRPINTKHWETQPSFSSDGKSLYFIRGLTYDRQRRNPDNQDIYVSRITDQGTWSNPEKLPSNINTPYREESVQIHPDGKTLYFASNGHQGMGGLDIYMSRLNDQGEWGDPINLGYPLNTFMDENSILISSGGKLGYFSSNRKGGFGSLDLYGFELEEKFRPQKVSFIKGKVFDAEDFTPLPAKFQLTNLETEIIISELTANSGNGEFLITIPDNNDLAFHAEYVGYNFVSKNLSFDQLKLTNEGYVLNIPMHKIQPGTFVLENIFFEINSWELKNNSIIELEKVYKMLELNSEIEIEISGHTDNIGDDESNIILSKNRAKAVVDWLVEKGIPQSRMSFIGYGETKPIVDNSNAVNRSKNRRTELTIK
jgi:outer membrane protein OmpA-like peptidoglycan-associated protein/Tol biopolymer transport system component